MQNTVQEDLSCRTFLVDVSTQAPAGRAPSLRKVACLVLNGKSWNTILAVFLVLSGVDVVAKRVSFQCCFQRREAMRCRRGLRSWFSLSPLGWRQRDARGRGSCWLWICCSRNRCLTHVNPSCAAVIQDMVWLPPVFHGRVCEFPQSESQKQYRLLGTKTLGKSPPDRPWTNKFVYGRGDDAGRLSCLHRLF